MATVMVIACPHALGLAVPLVVAISTSLSARKGLLIRNRTAFENARKITLFAFDKTGTLTRGKFEVSRYGSLTSNYSDIDILNLAAGLEAKSEHPIAMGIMRKANEKGIKVPETTDFISISGKGVEAKIGDQRVMVVSPGYARSRKISVPEEIFKNERETVVLILVEDRLAGFISLEDLIREESREAIAALKNSGMKVFMITGDNEKVAKSVSDELGLNGFFAEVLPDRKLDLIQKFKNEGEWVAMTGDGVNDAPALAAADVGIAVGSGTDVAAETADIILVNSNPKDIAFLVMFGRATYNKMIQNFIWATGYNVVAISMAAGIFYGAGILISPAIGAVFMSVSTIIVAFNAQLLKRKMKNNFS
jgi:P-type Cu2+ transporter